MKQVCPLLAINYNPNCECIYERCAWWNYDNCACAVAAIAGFLDEISTMSRRANNE